MLKLFIVEDEEIIRRGLVCTIDWLRLGAKVVGEAADGAAALAAIRETAPDVVLTDIRMPRMDGLELARQLHSEHSAAKIVFLTSYADFEYAQEAVRLQAADYLLKPVDEEELAAVLQRIAAEPAADPAAAPAIPALFQEYHAGNPYVHHVLSAIKNGYQGRLSIETLAAEQGVSMSYLSRKIKEETGQTFGTLLAQYRLQQSIELLAAGTWRVYEVAEQTGFGDYKNYCAVFKKYLHTTPKAFMQQVTGGLRLEGETEN
ncbi:two-component system, response regulator YesN [Selenomonas sp. GACV-9]|uniref:response regulator transcription factor n=1 Tax=Selenomonas sp. GACV-9 TaxID=3158782 RepID=UPI0008E8CC90|nr:two-component system, response regulator YesN [Selenomonas ruminantium]